MCEKPWPVRCQLLLRCKTVLHMAVKRSTLRSRAQLLQYLPAPYTPLHPRLCIVNLRYSHPCYSRSSLQHLPHGLPRWLPAGGPDAAHMEQLWPRGALHSAEAVAAGVL